MKKDFGVVVIILGLVVGCFAFSLAMAGPDTAALDIFYKNRLAEWKLRHQIWAALHFGLGLLSIVLSVAAASYTFQAERTKRPVCFSAAICAAILTFVSPTTQSRAFKEAWSVLDLAYQGFLRGEPNATQALNDAVKKGQEIIDRAGPW
jgi:hypothetical protein